MRFLKKKLERVGVLKMHKSREDEEDQQDKKALSCTLRSRLRGAISKPPAPQAKVDPILSTKNIVKNYGRAICNFAVSGVAEEYLIDIITNGREAVTLDEFTSYINENKEKIDTIERFQQALVVGEEDDEKDAGIKRIFREIGIIFIKYFSVNWVFSGRLTYKIEHLKFQAKMLRRLKNPELFTYLKPAHKRQKKMKEGKK
jgi:hypothetical protein